MNGSGPKDPNISWAELNDAANGFKSHVKALSQKDTPKQSSYLSDIFNKSASFIPSSPPSYPAGRTIYHKDYKIH